MLRGFYVPRAWEEYFMMLAAVAIAGAAALLLVSPLTRGTIALVARHGYRRLSLAALAIAVGLVVALTGAAGLLVMLTATGLGLIPVLFGSRRMNAEPRRSMSASCARATRSTSSARAG